MTTVVLAASYLSASLLSMLVPIATVVAVLIWGAVQIRRHERDRERIEARNRSMPAPPAAAGPRSLPGD